VLVEQATPRVLVIEHHVWMRSEVVAHLMAAGCQVQQASNGFSGFRLAHDAIPDMIVLGAELPDLASAELLEELECDPRTRSIPVIPLMSQAGGAYGSVMAGIDDALARQAAHW
jgi:DNA-binding response OmpR family regulator